MSLLCLRFYDLPYITKAFFLLNLFSFFGFLVEEIEAALSPPTAGEDAQSDNYLYETLKRGERDLDSKSSAYQLAFLGNVFEDGEYKDTAKRSRAIKIGRAHV